MATYQIQTDQPGSTVIQVEADHFYPGGEFTRFWSDENEKTEVLVVRNERIVSIRALSSDSESSPDGKLES